MKEKHKIRKLFRDTCFKRDKYCCVMCGFKSNKLKAEKELDCHHIIDRSEIANGGYVKENGISLCSNCHLKAEQFHITGEPYIGYSQDDLFKKIGSSRKEAESSALTWSE